ncbi:MAG: hypothetical protein ACYC5N_02325 [Endomicrobiales bacterium]
MIKAIFALMFAAVVFAGCAQPQTQEAAAPAQEQQQPAADQQAPEAPAAPAVTEQAPAEQGK